MTLLADAIRGQTHTVPKTVITPWIYEYSLPNDFVLEPIFVPMDGGPDDRGAPPGNLQPSNPGLPLTSGQATYMPGYFKPARFLISKGRGIFLPFPARIGLMFKASPRWGRRSSCATFRKPFSSTRLWFFIRLSGSAFREAMVAYLAAEIALPLNKDKKFGRQIRMDQMAIAEKKVNEARAMDANTQTNINSSFPDWINIRNTGRALGLRP